MQSDKTICQMNKCGPNAEKRKCSLGKAVAFQWHSQDLYSPDSHRNPV